jgi:hypothetical protein
VLEGRRREPSFNYPDEEFLYYFCAKEFGWTIEETDNQPAYMLDWVVAIAGTVKGVENDNQQHQSSN